MTETESYTLLLSVPAAIFIYSLSHTNIKLGKKFLISWLVIPPLGVLWSIFDKNIESTLFDHIKAYLFFTIFPWIFIYFFHNDKEDKSRWTTQFLDKILRISPQSEEQAEKKNHQNFENNIKKQEKINKPLNEYHEN
ncbi:MAG: hypothetical protein Q4D61_00980 [Cardiobacteriaceae bacterium]|nr:hypothetical protein [Cardiobacteriaceae bacterium]